MKLKVYNEKVIHFVWENITSFFAVDGPRKLGRSVCDPKHSVIIISHTKSIAYKYILPFLCFFVI
jgi:hypothetical protein